MLFSFAKTAGSLASPFNLLVLGLLVSMLLLWLARPEGTLFRWGKRIGVLAVLLLVAIGTMPLGAMAVMPLENKHAAAKLPKQIAGIIVVTADENPTLSEARKRPVLGHAAQRYIHVGALAKTYPDVPIVIAGNTRHLFPARKLTTKDVIQPALDTLGVARARTTYEQKSRNTHENAVFSAKMMKEKKKGTWILVTSAFHMPRTVLCFEQAGWKVVPAASDYLTTGKVDFRFKLDILNQMRLLNIAAHEYYGLLAYWLMGWIAKPW